MQPSTLRATASRPTAAKVATATTKMRKNKTVSFSTTLIAGTAEVPAYDRTAVPSDIFTCDICGLRIPAGFRGFEPYATCDVCEDGFDVCGSCCGTSEIMKLCYLATTKTTTKNRIPGDLRPTMRVEHHKEHPLQVVDRSAEVVWANGGSFVDKCVDESKKSHRPRARSKTPKKKGKIA